MLNLDDSRYDRSWCSSGFSHDPNTSDLGQKKSTPEGVLLSISEGWRLFGRAEADYHLPVIKPVDSDSHAEFLSNAEGSVAVLHLLCLNLLGGSR
jgi:hypothetical protein